MTWTTLARDRRPRRGRDRRPLSCRANARCASGARRRRRAPSRARSARSTPKPMSGPSPIEDALDTIEAWRGKPRLRARQRRSVLLRRRNDADAPVLARRDGLPSRAFGLCARRGAARLEPAGLRDAVSAWPSARGDHSASAAGRADSGALLGRNDAGKACGAAHGARHGAIQAHDLRGDGRPDASASATAEAQNFALDDVAALNTIALEVFADRGARVLPRAAGLPDDWFEHDGQITKRDIRAITLSALAPRRGELLWDVGAGAGSVAIEWMLADPANRAVAIEARHDRAARIARNALTFGAPALCGRDREGAPRPRRPAPAGRRVRRRRRNDARTDRPGGRRA